MLLKGKFSEIVLGMNMFGPCYQKYLHVIQVRNSILFPILSKKNYLHARHIEEDIKIKQTLIEDSATPAVTSPYL